MSELEESGTPSGREPEIEETKGVSASGQEKFPNRTPEFPYRINWYQTDSHVVVTVFRKKENQNDAFDVTFTEKTAQIVVATEDGNEYSKVAQLEKRIDPSKSSYKVSHSKVELKMKKAQPDKWAHYELAEVSKNVSKTKDWDKLAKTIEEDKLEGDALLNKFFGDIYSSGSDEVKKAMIKSFYESGGTELSTNWDKVSKDRVTVKPPDGMEWKTWDQ